MFFRRKKSVASNQSSSSGVSGADSSADKWDQFLRDAHPEIGFMQSSWWAHYMNQRGWGHFGAILRDGDQILGGARALKQAFSNEYSFYYLPEAPVLPPDPDDAQQVFEATLNYLDARRQKESTTISHVRIEPRWLSMPGFITGYRTGRNWLEPRDTLHIDLSLDEAGLLARMKPKGRYNIRLAQRHGVTIVQRNPVDAIESFIEIHRDTAKRQDMRGEDPERLRELAQTLSVDNRGLLMLAMLDDQPVAAALLVFFGDRATYLFGGSLNSQRQVMAPYLMHYEAILESRRRGHRWYDFYGVSPVGEQDHAWAGISAFKRKFGGVELAFIPPLDFVYDEAGYRAYQDFAFGSRRSEPPSATA